VGRCRAVHKKPLVALWAGNVGGGGCQGRQLIELLQVSTGGNNAC
jgi:hypothetical protein